MKYKFYKFFVILILLFFSIPQNAFAHAQLIKEFPLGNSEIVDIPEKVSLDFDNQIIDLGSGNDLRVLNKDGVDVSTGDVTIVGANLSKSLSNTLEPGKYTVSYRVVSEDGHVVTGEYFFSIVESKTKTSASNKPEKSKVVDAIESQKKSDSDLDVHKEHNKNSSFLTHHRTHIIWTFLILITLVIIQLYRRFKDQR